MPVEHRVTDPVEGERVRPVAVVPEVTVTFEAPVLVLPDASPRPVRAMVRAFRAGTVATIALQGPPGFRVTPESVEVRLERTGEEKELSFTLTPPAAEVSGEMTAVLLTPSREPAHGVVVIDHRHIPPQLLLPPAVVKVVRLDAKVPVRRVGYIPGAGDELPGILRQLGMEVTLLDEAALAGADLSRFETIVTGVRAYNTRTDLVAAQARGCWSSWPGAARWWSSTTPTAGWSPIGSGPFPFKLSRDRVTDETAAVRFLLPDSPLLSSPNRIGTTTSPVGCRSVGCTSPAVGTRPSRRLSAWPIPARRKAPAPCSWPRTARAPSSTRGWRSSGSSRPAIRGQSACS